MILETIAVKFTGGPVGLTTLADAIDEEPDTIEGVYEPYLIQQGLIKRTPRGRVLTERGYEHMGLVGAGGRRDAVLERDWDSPLRRWARPAALLSLRFGVPFFICPNCGNRELSNSRTAGFSNRPKSCAKCGAGFIFELLDDYYPAPDAAFFTCDKDGKVLDVGRGGFELTGLKDEDVIGRPVRDVLGLEWKGGDDVPEAPPTENGESRPDRHHARVGRSLARAARTGERRRRPSRRGRGRRLPRL